MNLNFRVVSDSMSPLIPVGSLLEVSAEFNVLERFDIILFKRNSQLVTHFIWKNQILFNNSVITRSLKNFYTDEEPVAISDIVGIVSNYRVSRFCRSKILLLCLLKGSLT